MCLVVLAELGCGCFDEDCAECYRRAEIGRRMKRRRAQWAHARFRRWRRKLRRQKPR